MPTDCQIIVLKFLVLFKQTSVFMGYRFPFGHGNGNECLGIFTAVNRTTVNPLFF